MSIVNPNDPKTMIEKPSYLTNLPKDDLKDMKKFLSPPRIKIVQGQTGAPFKPAFRDGDVLVNPQMIHIGSSQQEFTFVPIHFFPTWICTNPWELKNQLPFIRELSFEEDSIIAKKARAFIEEPCPENPKERIKYRQVLNYLVRIRNLNVELPDDPVTMIFYSGEFNTGRALIGLIDKRESPRYVCQFNAISAFRTGKKGNWHGLDLRNSPEPWVPAELVESYRQQYLQLKTLVDNRQIQIDMDDTDMGGGDSNAANETKF